MYLKHGAGDAIVINKKNNLSLLAQDNETTVVQQMI
jgi:hypothetical protein